MNANMKKIVNVATPAVCVVALALSVVAFSKTNAANTPNPAPVVASVTAAGQPVDLTYAAEKALPSVVLSAPMMRAEYSLLSVRVTVSSSAPSTTWLLVTM